jgi:hypothetical protein
VVHYYFGEKRGSIMELMEMKPAKPNLDHTKIKVFNLITQCIRDIEKTVNSSGLAMRDVGVDVERYMTMRESYIIELKLRM